MAALEHPRDWQHEQRRDRAALLGGVIVGTDETLGVVLFATGLLLVVLHRHGRHHPPTPHG